MDPVGLLHAYLDGYPGLFEIVYTHSRQVADKALRVADAHPELAIDKVFVEEAALVHDIGVFKTNAPAIACHGTYPYLCHGYLGRDIMEKEGFPAHGLVCERHVGTGLTVQEIVSRQLPLPHRDMVPVSLEEQLICYTDLFFSKSKPGMEATADQVRGHLLKYGEEGLARFDRWQQLFSL